LPRDHIAMWWKTRERPPTRTGPGSPPPPLPGPSPAARAAAAAAASATGRSGRPATEPPPLPGPSPAARQQRQQTATGALRGPNAHLIVTGEEAGIKLGVLRLQERQRPRPEFCCKCGLRDSGGRFDAAEGVLYCGECWNLLEDMAALRVSAGLDELQRRDVHTWEERCEDCGERDTNGAVDERDGNFYCSACWSAADFSEPAADSRLHSPSGGMSVCHECGCVGLGEVDESDGNFYCNGCWAAIGLGRATPDLESTTPDTAVSGADASGWHGVLPSDGQKERPAAKQVPQASAGVKQPQRERPGDDKPPPLPGPSPAARAAAVYGGLAPLNIQPSLLNEHYIAGPFGRRGSSDGGEAGGGGGRALAPATAVHAPAEDAEEAPHGGRARLPVREHLRAREEREGCSQAAEDACEVAHRSLLQAPGSREKSLGGLGEGGIEGRSTRVEQGEGGVYKEQQRREEEGNMSARERERVRAKERQKQERERRKEWKVRVPANVEACCAETGGR